MAIPSASLSLPLLPRTSSPLPSLGSSNSVFFSYDRTLLVKKSNCVILSSSQAQKGLKCNCLFGLGVPELAVIAGVAALVFGPKKLPEVGRSIGKTLKSFQQHAKFNPINGSSKRWSFFHKDNLSLFNVNSHMAAKEFEIELKKDPEASTESLPDQPAAVSEGKNAGEKKNLEVSGTTDSS